MYFVLGGKYKLLGSIWYLKVSTSYLDSTWYLGVSTSYKKELVLKLQVTVLNTPLIYTSVKIVFSLLHTLIQIKEH